MNAETINSIDLYKPAEYLLDVGFENIYNSYSNEFPEISQNNSYNFENAKEYSTKEDYNSLFFIKRPDFPYRITKNENKEIAFINEKIFSKTNENTLAKKLKLENEKIKIFDCSKNTNQNSDGISNPKLYLTKIHSDSNSNKNSSKIQQPRKYFRVDDAKKHFKVAISQFATEEINSLIKNSDLSNRFKKNSRSKF